MDSRDSLVATAVAKKLKKYLDIQRREQAFDLSALDNLGEPSKYSLAQRSKINDQDLERLTKVAFIEHELKVNPSKHLTDRELQAKANLEFNMSKFKPPVGMVSPYKMPVVGKKQNLSGQEVLKRRKKRRVTSARVGRASNRSLRSAPSQRITNAERDRIVNMTTKLLVATETIALPQDRNHQSSQNSHTTSEENYPLLPAVRKLQQSSRPKSAYSDPGPKSKVLKEITRNRTHSADQNKLEQTIPGDSLRDGDFLVKKLNGNYVITKQPDSYPSSILSGNSSVRPKSAKQRTTASKLDHFDFSTEEEGEVLYHHSSSEVTPLPTPKRAWSEDRSESDVPGSSDYPLTSAFNEPPQPALGFPPIEYKRGVNMATQTKPQPKVLTYAVYVVTGNKVGAETTASVKITLFGEYGDSGDRPLFKSRVNRIPFKRNQVDVFNLDCMGLGKLSNIRIGHNGTTKAEGWYLDRVVINIENEAYEFLCRRWLSAKEDDGQTVRDILLTSQIPISQLPSVSIRRLSSTRLSGSSEEKVSNSGRNSSDLSSSRSSSSRDKIKTTQQISNKTLSRNNSFKRKNNRLSSGSYTSSSDSDAEIELRQYEKQKRREKRYIATKDLPNQDKAKANVGGIINKVSQGGSRTRNKNRESPSPVKARNSPKDTSPARSQKGSGRDTPTTPAKKEREKKALVKESPLKATLVTDNNVVEKPSIKENVNEKVKEDIPAKTDTTTEKQSVEEKKNNLDDTTQHKEETKVSLSISSTSSSSSSSDTSSEIEDDEKSPKKEQNEEKVEISNKDTSKKYSESAVADQDDLYMAGFIAGIKANQTKHITEEDEEDRKKREFEEKLKNGPTIHQACETGDLDRLKELISLVSDLKNKTDERGWAPIHISSAFGHLDLVKWLSVNGVDLVAETPTGYTAIHLAAMNGHVNCMMILSAMGCPISSRTVDLFTPLHLASMSGHIECVKWLLSNRAKIDVEDANERKPLDLAEEYQHDECIQLLKSMKRELSRKDSVMAMLRDHNALRPSAVENADVLFARGGDSGVGAEDEEEWVSDTEGASDVVGRGGDDRPEAVRRASALGRKSSATLKGGVSARPPAPQRRLSKQDVRQANELEEKKKMYDQQVRRQVTRRTSFLDSIRSEIDGDEIDNNF